MVPDPHRISLPDALQMVQRARTSVPTPVKGWGIDATIIRGILDQAGATGLRAYMAAREDGTATLVYVGIDEGGKDMVNGILAEYVWPCPPICDYDSPFSQL